MSTRSGKRIHCSISENVESVSEIQTVRKTRSKRDKQNSDEVPTAKKKKNFVRRPSDDEIESPNEIIENTTKSVRKSRRHTLKELNKYDVVETSSDRKSMRQSRRIRKEDIVEPTNVPLQENNVASKGKKKNRKKKRAVTENLENEPVEDSRITKKKSNKKRKSNSFIVEELVTGENNKSNVSIDSFHSAAGSPENDNLKNKSLTDEKGGKTLTSNNSVAKAMKKKIKKTEDDKCLVSSINKSIELSAENESFETSCNKTEKNEDKYGKTVSKKKRSTGNKFVNNIENTSSIELNHMETNIQITDLKRKSIEKTNEIKTSNFDFTDIPPVNGTLSGSESFSPSNNSNKKRKSIFKNSEKIDISTTLINEGAEEKSDNLINGTKMQCDENTLNNSTSSQRSKNKDATYEKINLSDTNLNQTFDKINNSFDENIHPNKEHTPNNRRGSRRSSIKNTTYDKIEEILNKDPEVNSTAKKSRRSSRISLPLGEISTVLNGTYDKISKDVSTSFCNNTFDKLKLDTTSEKTKDSVDGDNTINLNSKSSIISSDNTENITSDMSEDCSRISITSDDSRTENIVNTTPLLVESSIDESQINSTSILLDTTATPQGSVSENKTSLKREETFTDSKTTPLKRDGTYTDLRKTPSKQRESFTEPVPSSENPTTPLKREGTFTKESPDVTSLKPTVDKTPTRRQSMPSPGRTPFPSTSSSKGRAKLNVTHSIEKPQRRSSIAVPPRLTKVMFCSPVDNPVAVTQMKGKVIKSNLKGSNKSFMFDESVSEASGESRKRSRTQGGAEDGAKRARLALRQRTTSAAARLQIPAEATPPAKSDAKTRTKLPDFAALHQKHFSKMESLDECQRRRAKRARALLTPSRGPLAHHNETLDTAQPKATEPQATKPQATEPQATKPQATEPQATEPQATKPQVTKPQATKPASPKSKEFDKKNQSYTRFGFKLNMDVNPFSVTKNTEATKNVIQPKALKRQATLPSLAGTTLRKDVAKQTVMREKSFTDRRDQKRNQNRTVIKGVRTNRRFELQMKMRNID